MAEIPILTDETTYLEWKTAVLDLAFSKCTQYSLSGLAFIVVLDSEWAEIDGNTDAAGVVIPRPAYVPPEALPQPSNASVIAIHKDAVEQYNAIVTATADLKSKIITSIGPDNKAFISHAITGMRGVTILNIMTSMDQLYNIPNKNTIDNYTSLLSKPMTGDTTFQQYVTMLRTQKAKLQQAGQPVSEYNMVQYLLAGISMHSSIAAASKTYLTAFPKISDQHFDDLVRHIILHEPNHVTSATAGYANSASGKPTYDAKFVSDAISKGIKDGMRRERENNNNKNNNTQSAESKATKYCFRHGYNFTHLGVQCNTMIQDSKYTKDQKNAKSPTDSPGGNANIHKSRH